MKKTVSINIGGIIFHIEEDGYDKLKSYLDSVNQYFSSFEDSGEIIADIESRIAEIFLAKLSEGRQTVNVEDVNDLISTMGTTQDFEATIESDPEPTKEAKAESEEKEEETTTEEEPASKRLYRDTKRGILGGVASGIAHYFRVDPLWIRLLFLALLINFFFGGLSGATFLAYIVLWIVLPPNADLSEDKKVKKLFRNSDGRVLGGVASGIASYFGVDPTVIRLLFVLSIFLGGAGILIYIVLWIITPEAKTITEKMQMQGEPVTLSNIEQNVKKSFNVREGEESPLVKVLLFPFRLIALVISWLGKILGPALKVLAEVIRIAFGLLLVLIGFTIMISLIAVLLSLLGFSSVDGMVNMSGISLDLIRQSIEPWPVVGIFLASFIPALSFTLLGLVIILRKRVVSAYVGWSLFALWIIGLFIASFSIPRYVSQFSAEEDIRIDQTFEVTEATPTLRLNETGFSNFDEVELRLRGHSDSNYQLILNVESRGRSRDDAKRNAEGITYEVVQQGDDFYFDSNIGFPKGTPYRFQNVDATFYIPYGKVFRMDADLADILINTLHLNGYRAYQMENNDWVFEKDGIKCITCPDKSGSVYLGDDARDRAANSSDDQITYPFEDFDEIKIASFFDVSITKSDDWSVIVRGRDNDLDDVYLNQVGDLLEVKYREDNWKWWKDNGNEKVSIVIRMPELEYLELVGDCDGEIKGFDSRDLTISLTGASDLYANVNPRDVDVTLTGASKLKMRGSAERLTVELVGASGFEGFGFEAERVKVDALGASKAEVLGTEEINIEAAGVSKIKYRGTRNVNVNQVGVGSVERD